MKNFEGKTAVITGAASGIGKSLAEKFAKENMQVVLADIEEDALEKTVENLRHYQHRVIGIKTDVLVEDSIKELFAKAKEEYGNIHILCNNAGIGANSGNKAIWEIDKNDWDWVMGVNYQAVLHGLQTFIPHMLEHGEEGHVVTTVSMAGLLPGAGTYGVSKHAVMALTEALSRDLQARGAKINASVLCPGFVDTNIDKSERNRPNHMNKSEEVIPQVGAEIMSTMLRQGKKPNEVADIVHEAIKENIFYILSHPAWDDSLKSHFENILSRKELNKPSEEEMVKFFQPRQDGEKY
jgi:NAD(P)-dependent dehydrogenase (short-subunit alcohol dehydrogenase family)|tara:strand:+ start:2597 stop:3481 length:885 start_codon:yes stop_codon:yes gene_type:complete